MIAAWLGFGFGVLTMLVALAVALSLTGCATGRLPADEHTNVQLVPPALALDALASLPPYLVPAPAGSSPRQRRQWQRSQVRNLARAGIAPQVIKIKHSALATAPGAVAVAQPAAALATGAGAATDNRKAGQRGGAAATGQGSTASNTTTKAGAPWWLWLLVAVAGAVGWEYLSHHTPLAWLPWRVRPD